MVLYKLDELSPGHAKINFHGFSLTDRPASLLYGTPPPNCGQQIISVTNCVSLIKVEDIREVELSHAEIGRGERK